MIGLQFFLTGSNIKFVSLHHMIRKRNMTAFDFGNCPVSSCISPNHIIIVQVSIVVPPCSSPDQ